ncbi:hypothetical protein A3860_17085 [Niastella vici]|uniref:Carbohydrate-binding protein SusD n=1 Tax=Niastella vici TaxID=1703345 RepID=A0A1V9G479_9BACT|nr:RagB/SusD family nutrient uptake outer membrane protein [Niastella vici]OQP65380.1 hypothetical protein A3860_17085 [Niastella vici]
MNSKYKLIKKLLGLWLLLSIASFTSCKKLVEISAPVTSVNGANVYLNDVTATSVLTGLYTTMSRGGYNFTGNGSISMNLGLSADELTLFSGVSTSESKYYYYTNSLFAQPTNGAGSEYWAPLYQNIFICNAAIEGLNASVTLTPAVKEQLLGEATFMRAFFYFYLVNMFGDVPLLLNADYKRNATLPRTPISQVYQQIITDLNTAQGMLNDKFVDASVLKTTSERTRPNKWAATALLARTFLYTGDWPNAITEASSVINNSSLFTLTALDDAFLANSNEAIWQLQPVSSEHNTEDAWHFILPSSGPDESDHPVYLSPQLLYSFEASDQRRAHWIDSVILNTDRYYYPFKYKSATSYAPLTEYLMVFRLAEQYLIRAEAEAQKGDIQAAQNDLNIVRHRAGLANTTAADKSSLLAAILHERQVELFSEWGHRWLDLKRTNNVDAVMTFVCSQKNSSQWKNFQKLFPLPFKDINADINLAQNSGY